MDWFFSSAWELFESYLSFGFSSWLGYLSMAILTFFIFAIVGIASQCKKGIKDINDDTFDETIIQSIGIGMIWPLVHLIVGAWLIIAAGAALLVYLLRFLKKPENGISGMKSVQ